MCVLLAGCRLRGHCGRGLLGARDHQGYEHHRHDERPHGRENSGETSNRCKDASGNRPSGQKQCAGQDEDAAADECAELEDEAAVPTPNQPNRLRDSCGDKQAAEKEPEPPGPAVHLPTVSAQPRTGPCLSVGDHPLRRLDAPRAGHAALGRNRPCRTGRVVGDETRGRMAADRRKRGRPAAHNRTTSTLLA